MTLKTLKFGIAALALFTISFSAQAQEKKEPDFEKMMKRFDADKNSTISLEEFKSAKRKKEVPTEKLEKQFTKLDSDSSGEVTIDELKTNWSKGKKKKKQ
ncbi:hypothetical protein Q4566_00390 [Tamlana sp. 2_MG-2023]|uniref:hypothetical protein n=1 Tax=unclassified Tamlana TaxID=2614803 RepID=UPI0026E397B2|nr:MULTISPECIES: hypothetical protein [unclassified Tamlana]MDO6758640.1 hypothetical protein [Tamlana sp. 2_MG-2023]MDO6789339.1 hypothetical protein [Tamlana sp. 1_MG-2023]